ncbi:MAG: aromatic-ring-hydroxylating dioxygenase subunit beta [Pseudomonadales bacterium]
MSADPDMNVVEDFLYREASYLDVPDLEKWLALYSEDGTYWMPASENQLDPLNEISHFYDDRVLMEIRKRNFVHPRASSKDAGVRCSHLIGNVRKQGESQNGDWIITSNFQVVMFYREEQRLYAGTYEHQLIPSQDSFLIRSKRVNLINPEAAHKSIIIYL